MFKKKYLIALLAAGFLFSGCSNGSSDSSQSNSNPENGGGDSQNTENTIVQPDFVDSNASATKINFSTNTHWSKDGDWIKFNCSHDSDINKGKIILADKEMDGFEVSCKKTSGYTGSGHGVVFCYNYNINGNIQNFYFVYVTNNGGYTIQKVINGKSTSLINWSSNDNLNQGEGSVNKIKVLKDSGNYSIYINDVLFYTIENPELKTGKSGYTATISQKDTPSTVSVTEYFKFNKYISETSTGETYNKKLAAFNEKIQTLYKNANEVYFNNYFTTTGSAIDFHLGFAKSKDSAAQAYTPNDSGQNIYFRSVFIDKETYEAWNLKARPNEKYHDYETNLKYLVVHEMTHAWFDQNGNTSEGHGENFAAKIAEFNAINKEKAKTDPAYDFTIPAN